MMFGKTVSRARSQGNADDCLKQMRQVYKRESTCYCCSLGTPIYVAE